MSENQDSWHLSKSVPISLIFALVVQAGAIVWTVSSMSSGIQANQERLMKVEVRTETLEKTVQSQAVMLARMDENIKSIRETMDKIADKLDKLEVVR